MSGKDKRMDFTGEWITQDGSRATAHLIMVDPKTIGGYVTTKTGQRITCTWETDNGTCLQAEEWDLVERWVPPEQRR